MQRKGRSFGSDDAYLLDRKRAPLDMMSSLEEVVFELEADGRPVTLQALGGVDDVLASDFQMSAAFGVVTGALSKDWATVGDNQRVIERLADGHVLLPGSNGLRLATIGNDFVQTRDHT